MKTISPKTTKSTNILHPIIPPLQIEKNRHCEEERRGNLLMLFPNVEKRHDHSTLREVSDFEPRYFPAVRQFNIR